MLKRPTERKEILAELLKLNQYDDLEERAKDVALFQRSGGAARAEFAVNGNPLHQREVIALQRADLETQLNQLQQEQAFDNIQLQSLQVIQHSGKLGSNRLSPAAIPKS